MPIFTNSGRGNGKQKWTREQDAALIAMQNEGKGRKEIAKATGHPENSITYRVGFIRKAAEAVEAKATEAGEEVVDLVEQTLSSIKY